MRKSALALSFFLLCSTGAFADPFLSDKATINAVDTLELEIKPTYRNDKFKSTGDVDFTYTTTRFDVLGRWVPVENWEAKAVLPYASHTLKGGGASETDSGLSQIILGGKYGFRPDKAVSVGLELPTGDNDKLLGEGTNVDVAFLMERDMTKYRGTFNAGYVHKTEFNSNFDIPGAAAVKVDPGNVLYLSGAITGAKNEVDLTGELYLAMVGKTKTAGTSVAGSDGTVMNIAVSAAKLLKNDWKLKGGLALGLGEEGVSSFDLNRPAGDWRLLLSASYVFDLAGGSAPPRKAAAPAQAPARAPARKSLGGK